MKQKINLEEIMKEELLEEMCRLLEREGLLDFIDYRKIGEIERTAENFGYDVGELEILGKKYGIVMKKDLSSALFDPQARDPNMLQEAGREISRALTKAYGKKQLKPLDSNVERTLFRAYLSSLLMNLINYPTDQLNEETLREMGLLNEDIRKLYVSAAASWLGNDKGLEKITSTSTIVSSVKKIGYSGRDENINLSVECCHSYSHYVFKPDLNRKQIDVQIELPQIPQNYLEIENQIVEHVEKSSSNETTRRNARNLVRLYLNTALFYEKGKPINLEW